MDRTWEETVMDTAKIEKVWENWGYDKPSAPIFFFSFNQWLCQAQAKITGDIAYNSGYEEGFIQSHEDIKKMGLTGISAMEEAIEQARKDGIKEVVDWIRKANHSRDYYYSFDQREFESKLKEWGLEK